MTDERDRNIQGNDPKGTVFAKSEALLYAAEGPISGVYIDQSRRLATYVDAALGYCGGMQGKRVLDAGSGYGTTALALTRLSPAHIVSFDASDGQIDLMRAVYGDGDLAAFLEARDAKNYLGDYYQDTLTYLLAMRREYKGGVFNRNKGTLDIRVQSILDVDRAGLGTFDAVVANNMIHWPINAKKKAYLESNWSIADARVMAITDAIRPLTNLLRPGGVIGFLEPKDFILDDVNAERDHDLDANNMARHPLYTRIHSIINRILLERYKITRKLPGTNDVFYLSTLLRDFASCGLALDRVIHTEAAYVVRPVDSLFVRMPMWLGAVDLPFATKLEIGREAKAALYKEAPPGDFDIPIRSEEFVFLAHKPA